MPKEKKTGWEYFFSRDIKKEFALHIATGWVYFEDGVMYSPEELNVLEKDCGVLTLAVHNTKLHIGGTLVESEPKQEKLPAEIIKQGELDIF